MEIVLLGTGNAAGWPVPWCGCESCTMLRARGEVRATTAALVDGVLLLDCGPDAARAAERHGVALTDVQHVLVGHAHGDHWAPQTLRAREYGDVHTPLELVGPPAVVATAPQLSWLSTRSVSPGDRLSVGRYDIRVLAARHGGPEVGPAVLYDITGPDGARLLWATDTGPLPAATLASVQSVAFDAVLLEETWGDVARQSTGTDHHDLAAFAATVDELRGRGAIVTTTRVLAVHLGHRNPPDVATRLAAIGAEAPTDGARLQLPGAGSVSRAGRRVLVLGGTRSGKSAYAESLLAGEQDVTYVATGPRGGEDPEWARRVRAHVERRPAAWHTVESVDVAPLLARSGTLLIDSVSLWLTGAMTQTGMLGESDAEQGIDDPPGDALAARVDALVSSWAGSPSYVVAVSDEVGLGVHPPTALGRIFRDELGQLNARLAATADEVWLVVAGIARRLR